MLQINNIVESLKNRVGIEQRKDPDFLELSSDVTTSESGLLLGNIEPTNLYTEKILSSLPFIEGMNFNTWDSAENYGQLGGQTVKKVLSNGLTQVWVSIANDSEDNLDKDPETEPLFWKSKYSEVLENIRNGSIREVINDLLIYNKQNIRQFVTKKQLFHHRGQGRSGTVEGFLGFCIVPTELPLKFIVDQIGFKYSVNETIQLRIYHSSNTTDPIYTQDIEVTDQNYNVYSVEATMNNESLELLSGGYFLVGFNTPDLSGTFDFYRYPDYYSTNFWTRNCNFCYMDKLVYRYWYRYFSAFPAQWKDITDLGDNLELYNTKQDAPFNLYMTVETALEEVIDQNKHIFDKLIQMRWAIDILGIMRASTRISKYLNTEGERQQMRSYIDVILEGNKEAGIKGLKDKLKVEFKNVKFDLENVDSYLTINAGHSKKF